MLISLKCYPTLWIYDPFLLIYCSRSPIYVYVYWLKRNDCDDFCERTPLTKVWRMSHGQLCDAAEIDIFWWPPHSTSRISAKSTRVGKGVNARWNHLPCNNRFCFLFSVYLKCAMYSFIKFLWYCMSELNARDSIASHFVELRISTKTSLLTLSTWFTKNKKSPRIPIVSARQARDSHQLPSESDEWFWSKAFMVKRCIGGHSQFGKWFSFIVIVIHLTVYHWNALNWLLLKLLVVGLIKLPKPDSDWWLLPMNWFDAPKLLLILLKLLLATFVLICAADVCGGIVGDCIGNVDGCVFTGLCSFSWFIDNDGPDDFDFGDSKLSKSILIGPAFDQVWPTIFSVVGFDWPLLSFWFSDIGCNSVLVGCSILADLTKTSNKQNEIH